MPTPQYGAKPAKELARLTRPGLGQRETDRFHRQTEQKTKRAPGEKVLHNRSKKGRSAMVMTRIRREKSKALRDQRNDELSQRREEEKT